MITCYHNDVLSSHHQVSPGSEAPTEGPWHTLYFLPGVHDIGMEFRTKANRSYYIPGDALVYGTMNNMDANEGAGIRIYGHGTISGQFWIVLVDFTYS